MIAAAEIGPIIILAFFDDRTADGACTSKVIEQLFDGDVKKGLDKLGQVATLNRCGKPEEVGNVVSFLLSDESSYVNGAKWEIDGGALATIRNDV